jgi:hypothetical protein
MPTLRVAVFSAMLERTVDLGQMADVPRAPRRENWEKGWGRGRAGARARKGTSLPAAFATPAFFDAPTFNRRETNHNASAQVTLATIETTLRRRLNGAPKGRRALRRTKRRAGLSHTLPGEGRRVLAAYSSAAPGSLGYPYPRPSLGRGSASRTAVPDPSIRPLDAIRGGADAVAPPLPIERSEPVQRAEDLASSPS